LGRHVPDAAAAADIALAAKAIAALGALDVGQAAVAQQGRVLGIEAAEGTDALIARAALYRSEEGARPVLVKLQKPEQERRVDLPTIGIKTVAQCADAGFAGIAIEAHATLVMGKAEVVAEADRRGLFVVAIPPPAATAKP
jgi:DUF1009 family protein